MKIKTFIFLSILCCPHVVLANVPSLFGLGSRASGMANSYTAIADDPFGWYYNPAGPASAKEIQLRLGFTSAIDNLQPIQGVILKNDSTVGSVPANYKNTLGTVIGGIIPIWSERVSVGASIFMPLGLVSRVHNQDPYLPSYTFYNDRTHRPNIILGAAWKPLDWFSIGGGVISGTTVGGTIYTDLSGDGGESVIEVKSTQTPTLGMKFYLGNIDVGVSYRGASAGRTKTRIIADSSAMPFDLESTSVSFYDPQEVSIGVAARLKTGWILQGDLTWANWANYIPSFGVAKFNVPDIVTSDVPKPNFKNSVTLRVGSEYLWKPGSHPYFLRIGYGYAPSPVPPQTGRSNFVDNDKHIGSLGFGTELPNLFGDSHPLLLDAHFQTQFLVPIEITKNDPSVIGGPGYVSGGMVYNFGMTFGTKF